MLISVAAIQRCSYKKVFWKYVTNFQENTHAECDFKLYWNHTSAQVFSCKFDAYFHNTFSEGHLWTAASVIFEFRCLGLFVRNNGWSKWSKTILQNIWSLVAQLIHILILLRIHLQKLKVSLIVCGFKFQICLA